MNSSRFLFTACLACLLICPYSIAQQPGAGAAPKGQTKDVSAVPAAARARISGVLGRDDSAYQSMAQPGGFRVENRRHGLSAEFTPTGVAFHAGANHWGLALEGYGYGDKLRTASQVAPHTSANRVEYRRGVLTEWYVNGPLGLEQGFTVAQAPGKSHGEPLTLALALSGDLTASVDPGERGLTLRKDGTAALRYGGLTATDAKGHELRAWLEVTENRLGLRVDDANAQYPLTVDPLIQSAKLTALDGTTGDDLGLSVSISCDPDTNTSCASRQTIVAGAPFATIGTTSQFQGAAYVFVKPASGWANATQSAKLTALDGVAGDNLGASVSISSDGGTIVAGARNATIATIGTTSQFQGAAYVFLRGRAGWFDSTQTAKLTAFNGATNDFLGASVSVSGDGNTIVAGTPEAGALNSPTNPGAVYVFVKPTTSLWTSATETAKLTASDGVAGDDLGSSVGISGDGITIVAEALFENRQIQAYVFVRPMAGWVSAHETAKLICPDAVELDSVAVNGDGNTIVAGAPFATIGLNQSQGAAYVFVKPTSGWVDTSTFNAKLTALNGMAEDRLGYSVGISGDGITIVATAPSASTVQGPAYVFLKPTTGWTATTLTNETAKLSLDGGASVAWNVGASDKGDTIVAGAPFTTVDFHTSQGAIYVFAPADPNASLFPTSLTFPDQAAGTTSSFFQHITLTNIGTAPLNITAVNAPADFTSTQYCVSYSPIAANGGTCVENVYFAPNSVSVGAFNEMLTFTDDSGGTSGTTQSVALIGSSFKANTEANITSVSPLPAFAGQKETISFSVVPQMQGNRLMPTGAVRVDVTIGGFFASCNGTVASGSCSVIFGAPGNAQITAHYLSDSNFNSSDSSIFGITVKQGTTMTTVSVAPSTAIVGEPVTVRVSVIPQAGDPVTPSGKVTVVAETAIHEMCTVVLPSTSCSLTFSAPDLPPGQSMIAFLIDATYSGDTNFLSTGHSFSETLVKGATTTSISAVPSTAFVNQPVTVNFTVTPQPGDPLIPGGSVKVQASTGEICTSTAVPSGSCSLTFSNPVTRTIMATYNGDGNFAGSTSSPVTETVVDFTLAATPASETISSGHMASYTLTLTALNGFTGTVALARSGGPPHSICTVSPNSVSLTGGTSTAAATVTLQTPQNANHGTFPLTFTASSGVAMRTAMVSLTVK